MSACARAAGPDSAPPPAVSGSFVGGVRTQSARRDRVTTGAAAGHPSGRMLRPCAAGGWPRGGPRGNGSCRPAPAGGGSDLASVNRRHDGRGRGRGRLTRDSHPVQPFPGSAPSGTCAMRTAGARRAKIRRHSGHVRDTQSRGTRTGDVGGEHATGVSLSGNILCSRKPRLSMMLVLLVSQA